MEAAPKRHYSDVKTLISWTAPGRPFRKKHREFYATSLLIVLFIELILFLFSQYALMFVVLTLYFFSIALAIVPPQDFHYKISTQGVKVEDHFYIWDELYDFYFKRIDGLEVLIIRTDMLMPAELKIPLGDVSHEHARQVLVEYLPYREIMQQTFLEKSGDWLAHNFPLER